MERCTKHTGNYIVYVAIHWSNDIAIHCTMEVEEMGKREIRVGLTTVVITGVPDDITDEELQTFAISHMMKLQRKKSEMEYYRDGVAS